MEFSNRKLNYCSRFKASDQRISFIKRFSFGPRFSKLIFKTGNRPILTHLYPSRPILTYIDQIWPNLTFLELSWPIFTYIEKSWPVLTYLELSLPILTYLELSLPILTSKKALQPLHDNACKSKIHLYFKLYFYCWVHI